MIIVKEYLPLRETGFDSFFKWVDDIDFLTSGHEDEGDLRIAKHVQYFVEHVLLAPPYVEVYIFKDEENAQIFLFFE